MILYKAEATGCTSADDGIDESKKAGLQIPV
jgi:hypothetical protein